MAPPLVVVTWHHSTEAKPDIVHHSDPACFRMLREWHEDAAAGKRTLVGQNIAFDACVIIERYPDLRECVFAAYDANGVTDTMIRQWLIDNAQGGYRGYMDERGKYHPRNYALEDLCKRHLNVRLQKDAWRTSYGLFHDYALEKWPERAVEVQQMAAVERATLAEKYTAHISVRPVKNQDKETIKRLKERLEALDEMLAGVPERATQYPLDDATGTLRVFEAQQPFDVLLKNQFAQAQAYFALNLGSVWGLRTDGPGVALLESAIRDDIEDIREGLVEVGLVRENGVKDKKAAIERMIKTCRENGLQVIRTDAHFGTDKKPPCPSQCSCGKPGFGNGKCRDMGRKAGHKDIYEDYNHPQFCREHVGLDKDACEAVAEFDDVWEDYSNYVTWGKVLSNDVQMLKGATEYPVHTRYGFAQTGRTTSSRPPIQNQSNREGIREAFVARPGYAFIQCDYPQLELYTLAQCCVSWFGYSKLAEVLLADQDPHLMVAAKILRIDYSVAHQALYDSSHPLHGQVKKIRKQAKPFNFGKPGGMGVKTLLKTTRKQMGRKAFAKLELTEAKAVTLSQDWESTWPEMRPYFRRIEEMINDSPTGRVTVETLFTGRIRGNSTYCAALNNGFQALGSDCAKSGVWEIAKACYVPRKDGTYSPLYNTRVPIFVHDENIGESPYEPDEFGIDERTHAAAYEIGYLMVDGANKHLPDVPIARSRMKPQIMLRWYKATEPVFATRPSEGPSAKKWLVPSKVVKQPDGEYKSSYDDSRVVLAAAA
jgi:hypothetical protein